MNHVMPIRYREIHKFFHRRHLLNGLSLSLRGGTAILLSGENGSGKTTLLRILSGLEKPARCLVDFGSGDAPWAKCRRQLQRQVMYLHQQPYLFDGDVVRNLALALPRTLPKNRRQRKIRQALEWAQLEGIAGERGKTLSSGEKQRVSLARAWLRQSRMLLLDEPIANMDRESRARTVALLKRLKSAGAALIIASHNHEVFNELIDRRLTLEKGKLIPSRTPPLPDNVTPLAADSRGEKSPKAQGAGNATGAGNASG